MLKSNSHLASVIPKNSNPQKASQSHTKTNNNSHSISYSQLPLNKKNTSETFKLNNLPKPVSYFDYSRKTSVGEASHSSLIKYLQIINLHAYHPI